MTFHETVLDFSRVIGSYMIRFRKKILRKIIKILILVGTSYQVAL